MSTGRCQWQSSSLVGMGLLVSILASCTDPQRTPEPALEPPARIISLVPNVSETLFALGVGDRVVAVSDYDRYPAEVFDKKRVGALLNPSVEKIFELDPDLVITYATQTHLRQRLRQAGIRDYPYVLGSIDDMLASIEELAQVVHAQAAGRRLTQGIRDTLAEIQSDPLPHRPRVLLAHSRNPGDLRSFFSPGSTIFYHELIQLAGGANLFGDVARDSIQPSMEEILRRQPEVIIELVPSTKNAAQLARRKRDWDALGAVRAVADDRVYVIAEDYMLVLGPRLDKAARLFAEVLRR